MKATGIVRKIDELGRVVIPKEIRKTLRVREGDAMEIFVDNSSDIILKKYSTIGEMEGISKSCAETIFNMTGFTCMVTDKENVIYACGPSRKEYESKMLSDEALAIIQDRQVWTTKENRCIDITSPKEDVKSTLQIIFPIISSGEIVGSIISLSKGKTNILDNEMKIIESVTLLVSKIIGQ